MRWFRRTIPLLLCVIATTEAAHSQKKQALAQKQLAPAAGQQKKIFAAEIAKHYQQQPGVQDQLTLAPPSQTAHTNEPVTVTVSCGSGFSCASFHFVWGDGQEEDSATGSANHTYSEAQSYTVYATAQATPHYTIMMASRKPPPPLKSNPVTVAVTAPQVSDVTLDARPSRVRVGNSITATATLTPADSDAQFVFDYGDGSVSQPGPNRDSHVYRGAGDYQITVTAYNSDHNAVASSNAFPVSVVALRPPTLTVAATPGQELIAGKPIRFHASSRPAPRDIQYQFHWNDGTPDVIAAADGLATHVFSNAGVKRVSVTGLTTELFAETIHGQTELTIKRAWPPLWPLVLALAVLATAVTGVRKWVRTQGVQVKMTQVTSLHQVRLTGGSYPQVSFELDPGLESAEHTVVIQTTPSKQSAGAKPVLRG